MPLAYLKTERPSNQKSVTASCSLCGGSGWRPVFRRGERFVVRCQHREFNVQEASADFKARAAGEL
jgi:hypothetical protein